MRSSWVRTSRSLISPGTVRSWSPTKDIDVCLLPEDDDGGRFGIDSLGRLPSGRCLLPGANSPFQPGTGPRVTAKTFTNACCPLRHQQPRPLEGVRAPTPESAPRACRSLANVDPPRCTSSKPRAQL